MSWKRGDGSEVPGYAFGDAGAPAVIVMQEWWGIDGDVLHNAAKLAARGFRTVVPDLYRGALGLEAEEAHHLMSNLNWPGAVDDIRGAAAYLKATERAPKVGVTGFCMGGALALAAGALVSEVDAVAPFYGIPGAGLADMTKMRVPVQGHFGGKDAMAGFSDPAAAAKLDADLKTAGVRYEVFHYPTVGHAFINETPAGIARRLKLGQGEHDAAAVELAWDRLAAFFDRELR